MLRPTITGPGELSEAQIRAMWRLRVSLLALKPEVDPERDFANFAKFVSQAYVGRILDEHGQPHAMITYQPEDGEFAGVRYRMVAFEYGFVSVATRGHPAVALMHARMLLGCRSFVPGGRNYFIGCGYPRSFMLLERVMHGLRFDGEPELGALERHLIDRFIALHIGDKYDATRKLVVLPTQPQPLDDSYRARYRDDPILQRVERRVPDWERGHGLIGISRLDGGYFKLGRDTVGRWQHGLRERLGRRSVGARNA